MEHRQWPVHRPVTRSVAQGDPEASGREGNPTEEVCPVGLESGPTVSESPLLVDPSSPSSVSVKERPMVSLEVIQSAPTMVQSSMGVVSTVSNSLSSGNPIVRGTPASILSGSMPAVGSPGSFDGVRSSRNVDAMGDRLSRNLMFEDGDGDVHLGRSDNSGADNARTINVSFQNSGYGLNPASTRFSSPATGVRPAINRQRFEH